MKVSVDPALCMGHGQCYAYAPDVYAPDADGFCTVLSPDPAGGQLQQAIQGAEACPESAITIAKESDV